MDDQAVALTSYCGPAPSPAELLSRWNLDPPLLGLICLVAVAVFAVRTRRLRLFAALAVFALIFVTPVCAIGSALFAGRVAHHAVIVALIAPLIAYGLPPLRVALVLVTAFQVLVFWLWHAPSAYAAAMTSDLIFWLMQFSLLGSATAFWMAVRSASAAGALGGLLATMVQMGLLGALITFAGAPLYAPHLTTTATWGLTPLEDQQIAGLIMWAPMAGVYLAAALAILARWIGPEPKAAAS